MLIQAVLDRPLEPGATSSQLLNKLKPVSVQIYRHGQLSCFVFFG